MNKELKKMSRKELLEILLEQAKRIEELENKIEKLNEKLESKKVTFMLMKLGICQSLHLYLIFIKK